MNKKVLEEVARRTGLTVKACAELFNEGWTYTEGIDTHPRWEKIPQLKKL